MRLSVCYMVKDEILTLPESIRNTVPYVDEICIVDTGSTDGTKGYLADLWGKDPQKIKGQYIDWNDDFSGARNKSLEMATGDWILILDADEWLDKVHYKKIRELMEHADKDAYSFTIMHFIQDPHWIINPKIVYGHAIRLFRNKKEYRYEGIVHNKLNITDSEDTGIGIYNFEFKGRHKVKEKAIKMGYRESFIVRAKVILSEESQNIN